MTDGPRMSDLKPIDQMTDEEVAEEIKLIEKNPLTAALRKAGDTDREIIEFARAF